VGELWFVGAGLGDERDLSRRALEALRQCERVFAEEYTSTWLPGSFDRLEELLGRPVERLARVDVESEAPVLDALKRSDRVGFLAVGDPFFATTHIALRLAAERAGHGWRYLPNASVGTAVAGFLGLSLYRFGRVASIPFPAPGFEPRSPLDVLRSNARANLHTLVLLDLDPERGRYLSASEGLEILRSRDAPADPAFPDTRDVAVVARVGREDARAWFGSVREMRGRDFGPAPHALAVPADELRFPEPEALARFRIDSE
jgi:diphthine synthase